MLNGHVPISPGSAVGLSAPSPGDINGLISRLKRSGRHLARGYSVLSTIAVPLNLAVSPQLVADGRWCNSASNNGLSAWPLGRRAPGLPMTRHGPY